METLTKITISHATMFAAAVEAKNIRWLKAQSNCTVGANEGAVLMLNLPITHNVPDVDIRSAWRLQDHHDMSIDGFLLINQESEDDWMSDKRDELLSKMNLQGIKEVLQSPAQ
jgi:hypothetical protein